MNTITPETFLNIVFELMRNNPHEVVYSVRTGDKWQNKYYGGRRRKIPIGTSATYYCVSTCKRDPSYPRRNRQTVREAWVVPFDDIGTKAREPSVEPSYKIETSVGNYQWGYLIHPFDVSTPEGQLAYDTVLYSAVKAGLNDPGCRSATRVVRLPGSLHKTGSGSWRIYSGRWGWRRSYPPAGSARSQASTHAWKTSQTRSTTGLWIPN
jgi:hypothetical protein